MSNWDDKVIGLNRASDLVYADTALPEEFRKCLSELLDMIWAYGRVTAEPPRDEALYQIVDEASRLARVIRERAW